MRPKEAQMGGHDVFVENTFNVIGILRAQHDPGVNGPGAAPHEVRQVTRSRRLDTPTVAGHGPGPVDKVRFSQSICYFYT
ncbi:hypothetical protein E4U36_006026 [Claviceps purpurea]|nr:hypothetical protein E4U36_006026 [Claviceps purpurea]